MLRTLTEPNNGINVKCESLDCKTNPIFAGQTLNLANTVVKQTEDTLIADRIIAGNGTNGIKDTLISSANDHIDLPANKAYKINGTTLLAHDGTNYNLDNLDNIRSSIDRDLSIDALGTGIINMSTLANGGFRFKGANDLNWAIRVTNALDLKAVVIGTYGNQPAIGGHTSNMTAWNPLYIQNADLAVVNNSYVVFGDVAEATANNLDSKIISQGGIYSTRHITSEDQLRFNKNNNGYHALGSDIIPTDVYQHQFQNKNGFVAHTNDLVFKNWSSDQNIEGTLTTGTVIIDSTIFKANVQLFGLECFTLVSAGTTAQLVVTDETTSENIATITIVGDANFLYSSTTTFSNLPAANTILSFHWNRTVGSGNAVIYGFILRAK